MPRVNVAICGPSHVHDYGHFKQQIERDVDLCSIGSIKTFPARGTGELAEQLAKELHVKVNHVFSPFPKTRTFAVLEGCSVLIVVDQDNRKTSRQMRRLCSEAVRKGLLVCYVNLHATIQ